MQDRKIGQYWWTWRDGDVWPAWYYGEQTARDAMKRLAYGSPGRKVSIGKLNVVDTIVLPDKLVST